MPRFRENGVGGNQRGAKDTENRRNSAGAASIRGESPGRGIKPVLNTKERGPFRFSGVGQFGRWHEYHAVDKNCV